MLIDVDVWHFWVEKFKSDDDDSMHAYYIYIYVYLYINKICFFLNLQMNQKKVNGFYMFIKIYKFNI